MKSIWSLLRYAPRHWRGLLAIVIVTLFGVLLEVLRPWPLKLIVDHVLARRPLPAGAHWIEVLPGAGSTHGLLAWLAGATVVLFVAAQAIVVWILRLRIDVGGRMSNDIAAQVLETTQRTPLGTANRATGDMVKRVVNDPQSAKELALSVVLPLGSALITLGAMFVIMWGLDKSLAIIAIVVAIPMAILIKVFAGPMADRSYQQQELEGQMMALAEQTLTAIPLVQAFVREEHEERRFRTLSAQTIAAYVRAVSSQLQFKVTTGAVLALGTAAVMWIGGLRAVGTSPSLSIGDLLVVLAYLASLYAPLETLAYLSMSYATAAAAARRVIEILNAQLRVEESPDAVPLPGAEKHEGTEARRHEGEEEKMAGRSIEWRDVSFGYERDRPVLSGLSLTVPAGKMLAVVGPTGAGKSTLMAMVPRLMDPWSGSVRIDGLDAKQAKLADLRAAVSMVLQDSFLLPLSVTQNIAYGRPGASMDEIQAAARAANAHDFITDLPKGYDTILGERGVTLSGGQRQRLAIARAILKDAPILILDEPTAALDAQTEQSVMQAIARLTAGRTCIVIAHRLSTVKKADLIAVLDGGMIAQLGSHDQLIAQDGLYQRLCGIQGILKE